MSYTVRLIIESCGICGRQGEVHYGPDPTYNLTQIFDLALTGEDMPNPGVSEYESKLFKVPVDRSRGLEVLSGKVAKDTIASIELAIERMGDAAWRPRLKALEPDNGWGDLDGALRVMKKLLALAQEYPSYTWAIC